MHLLLRLTLITNHCLRLLVVCSFPSLVLDLCSHRQADVRLLLQFKLVFQFEYQGT